MNVQRLIKRRKQLGLRQEDVAKKIGVEKGTYYRYEHGMPMTDPIIEQLARVLEVSADFLLGLTSDSGETLHEEGLDPEERKLIGLVRAGKMKEAGSAAIDLAERNNQSGVSSIKPASNS